MKFSYPAIFKKLEDDSYRVTFPDLDQCEVVGVSYLDAYEKAQEAEFNWITVELEDLQNDDFSLPSITDLCDIELGENERAQLVSIQIRLTDGYDE